MKRTQRCIAWLRRRLPNREKGQASVMMAFMMLTFVFFFAFVVNTGNLVNAKINLQNAADVAAYAGAAVQARQLTDISYLNYEMRRAYKKFLFRYYVMGNLSQADFPKSSGSGRTPMKWVPSNTPIPGLGLLDYQVPVVCIAYNPVDNYCQVTRLPKIEKPKFTAGDAINDTLIKVLGDVEDIRLQNCSRISKANAIVLQSWLWNFDPDVKNFDGSIGLLNPELQKVYPIIKSLVRGLGLGPKLILTHRRIKTLEYYLNREASKELTLEKVNSLQGSRAPAESERQIQAFLSAYFTLGEHTYSSDEIKMDELLPPKGEIVKLRDIPVKFDSYALTFELDSSGDCVPKVNPVIVKSPIPVAVYKDPAYLTYYAVRLTAKAQLMFSPFGSLNLKAYSAAQPFGSRIGPKLTDADFLRIGKINLPPATGAAVTPTELIPNLPLRIDDGTKAGMGWDTREVMGGMNQGFADSTTGNIPPTITEVDIYQAYHHAMVPNPYEGGKFNIPYDRDDPMVRSFDSRGMMAIWAPIFPQEMLGTMQSELESLVTQYMGEVGDSAQQADLDSHKANLTGYVSALLAGQGEAYDFNDPSGATREGFNVARIANPVLTRSGGGLGAPISNPPFAMTDPKTFKTSWNDVGNSVFEQKGRTGYSVKFVAFEYLKKGGIDTTGQGGSSKNTMELDDDTLLDMDHLQH